MFVGDLPSIRPSVHLSRSVQIEQSSVVCCTPVPRLQGTDGSNAGLVSHSPLRSPVGVVTEVYSPQTESRSDLGALTGLLTKDISRQNNSVAID